MKVTEKYKKTRRERGSLTKKEILSVSMEILRDEGVSSLSMRHIAKKLKCSVASPYKHFESQEDIIRHLILEGERRLTTDLKSAQDHSQDVYGQLASIAQAYWNFSNQNK